MKTLLSAFLVAALSSCFAPPSEAAEALWSQHKNWTILGDYVGYCRAESSFEGGSYISIGAYKDGRWNLIFGNNTADPMVVGQKYTIKLTTDDGSSGTFTGTAFDPKLINFLPMAEDAILTIAKAKTLTIGNFGTFNMDGSAQAIRETYACLKAITASGASAPAANETPVQEREA